MLTTLQNIIILTNAKEFELYFNICPVNINLHKPDVDEIYSAGFSEHFKSNVPQNTWVIGHVIEIHFNNQNTAQRKTQTTSEFRFKQLIYSSCFALIWYVTFYSGAPAT